MSRRQYQDPSYHSGHYQTPYPNPSEQHGHITQLSPPNTQSLTQGTYKVHSGQHASYPSYLEGSLQHQPPGKRHSTYARTVHFSEPRDSSAGHTQTYYAPSLTAQNLTVGTHQRENQGSYGYSPMSPSIGSHCDSPLVFPGGGSDATSSSGYSDSYSHLGVPSHPGGDYTATMVQPQGWGATGYDEGIQATGLQARALGHPPVGGNKPGCRYPDCSNQVFFDRRVNRLSEWCSDEHMQAAIWNRVTTPCQQCQKWPRWRGHSYCGGDICVYPHDY